MRSSGGTVSLVSYLRGLQPFHHKDPFDRIIIAQAKSEGLFLLSHDAIIRKYPITVEW